MQFVRLMKRRAAVILVGLMVFGHINVALASCAMDRGALAPMMTMGADDSSAGCEAGVDRLPNLCVAHCTADLQLAAVSASIVRSPAATALLIVPKQAAGWLRSGRLEEPRPGAPPTRILLHSFLV